ncbi:MAG: MATE family efflux transporter [Lachnospiraceae bacterium]|jgi:putative MATE family efflux protein
MKKHSNQIDMLHGPLAGKIVRFALPLALASILQQLFNSADLAVVGRFDSSTAMAAVGSNAALINLLVSLFSGLSLGTNVVIASLIGRGEKEKISDAVHTSVLTAFLSGCIVLTLGEIIAPNLLLLMSTPDEVLPLATLYLRIYFLTMPFLLLYDFGSSILRARGDSTRPLIVLIISGLVNIVLNIVFVAGFGMGVAGVATATVISNAISAVLVMSFLVRDTGLFHLSFRKLKIHGQILKKVIAIGAPAGLQGMVFSLSNVVIQSGINSFGADCIAGNTAAQNFEFMCYFIINGFSQATTTFTSQNFAAGKKKRCDQILRICLVIGLLSTLALSTVFYLGKGAFILIFTTDDAVKHYAYIRLLCIGMLELLTGTYEMPGGSMRGMGDSLTPAIITMLGSCVFRLVWIWTVFRAFHSIEVLLVVYPISWVICGVAMNIARARRRRIAYALVKETD